MQANYRQYMVFALKHLICGQQSHSADQFAIQCIKTGINSKANCLLIHHAGCHL